MKIRVMVSLGRCSKEEVINVPDEDIEDVDDITREKIIEDYAEEWLRQSSGLDFGWEVVEG